MAPILPDAVWELAWSYGPARGLDPALVAAVIAAESVGDARAVSPAGAQGLMQLMPSTAAGLGVADPFDARQNVEGGTRLLAGLLRQFGSVELALAAYNAGPGAVSAAGGIPVNGQTEHYVPKVMAYWQDYAASGQGQAPAAAAGAAPSSTRPGVLLALGLVVVTLVLAGEL